MRVATFNVRVDTDYDQDWQWKFRKNRLRDLINYHNWDLLAVQEVRPNQVIDLTELQQYEVLSQERDGDGSGEGLALLVKRNKFIVQDKGFFWLSETPQKPSIHVGAAYPRICVWALVEERETGQDTLVVDVHLDNESEDARYDGMRVVLQQLAELINSHPVIILGDFNAEPVERVHKLLADEFINSETVLNVQHYGPQGTFQNFKYSASWSELEKIDYIYTKGLGTESTGVITDSFDGKYISDHFPLAADLTLVNN